MEALLRQEELLKLKLEDASTIVERRQIRSELKEVRNKLANFSEDENANIVETKNDINANNIIVKNEMKVSQTVTKIIGNDSKATTDSIPSEKKKEPEYRVTDDSEELRIKTADERANRRARRHERMAKLAKEQTDDSNKADDKVAVNEINKREDETSKPTTNGVLSSRAYRGKDKDEKFAKDKDESRPKTYVNDRKTEVEKETVKDETRDQGSRNEKLTNQKYSFTADAEKKEEKNNNSIGRSFGSTPRTFASIREDKKEENNDRDALKVSTTSSRTSSWKKDNDDEKSKIVAKPEIKFKEVKETTSDSYVNTPTSLTSRTDRKEEYKVAIGVGEKVEGIKHKVETKSFVQNNQQTTTTRTTTSRVSSAFEKFNGNGNDRAKAISTIGKALAGTGSARNKFLNAEKDSTNKPVEFGLNFTKKSDKPGYTVKKFTEKKVEEKSTSFGKVEFGLSFLNKKKEMDNKSSLRETESGSAYKKASPSLQRRHQTAPAAPGQSFNFKLPGGGSQASSVADRMKLFKEAQDEEKARIEKQKQKEINQRARLASDPTPVKSPTSSTAPCLKKREVKKPIKRTMSISNIVLDWCKEMVKDYGIEIKNFSGSWSNGLAFCALIHKFNPDKFDFKELNETDRERNFRLAFDTALEVKNIPKLLDVDDMVSMSRPEPRSVQCYVQWIWSVYGPISGYGPSMEEIKQAQVA